LFLAVMYIVAAFIPCRTGQVLSLLQLVRVGRLLRGVPELAILLKGLWAASRAVFFCWCLLVLVLYIFGMIMVALARGNDVGEKYFKNVPEAMHTLFLTGNLFSGVASAASEMQQDPIIEVFFFGYIAVGLCIIVLSIGVLCEVVSSVAAVEKEALMVQWATSTLRELHEDPDGSGSISKASFEQLIVRPEAANTLQACGIDVICLVDMVDDIFVEQQDICFSEFMDRILKLRGSNAATVKDLVDIRRFIMTELHNSNAPTQKLEAPTENEDERDHPNYPFCGAS